MLVNKNFENEISRKRLYGFSGFFMSVYFDTEEELKKYLSENEAQFGSVCVIEYIGKFKDREDVIRVIDKNGNEKFYTAIDSDGYAIYNEKQERWDFEYGSIEEMYTAFRDRGFKFTNDIYAKINEYYQKATPTAEDIKRMWEETSEQKFSVMAVPCRRPFIVAKDKVEEFKNQKPNPEIKRQMEEMVQKLNISVSDEFDFSRTRKFDDK